MFKLNDVVRLTPDFIDELEEDSEGFDLHKFEHRHAEAIVIFVEEKDDKDKTLYAIKFIGDYRPFQMWVTEQEIELA